MTFTFYITLLILMLLEVIIVFGEAPTTQKILFSSTRDGNWEIYMMNPDGSNQVNLTQRPSDDFEATWSPTGEQILFVSNRDGKNVRDLYLMDPDGSNVKRVFKHKTRMDKRSPAWSPDGKQFVYWSVNHDRHEYDLYLATFGNEKVERLPYCQSPEWSPNGSEIACTVAHPTGRLLKFINLRTRKMVQPIPDKILQWQNAASWAAVGDRLAISGNRHPIPVVLDRDLHNAWNDLTTIYIVNRDGSNLRQLVDEAGPHASMPEISPDGSELIYTQEIKGRQQIFNLDINTGDRKQLTHTGAISRQANIGGDWFDPAFMSLSINPQTNMLTTIWGQLKK